MSEAIPEQALAGGEERLQWLARLRVDQFERWHRGDRVGVESYREQEPTLRADEEALLDLIYSEILLREEMGEEPQLEEYLQRFPEHEGQIRQQFILHDALTDGNLVESLGPATFIMPPPGGDPASDPATPTFRPLEAAHPPGRPRETQSPPAQPTAGPGGGNLPIVPGYDVLGELGRGGMGVVYWVWQTQLHRSAALKMMLGGALAGTEALARFRTEAEAAARLQHPNIVQIYEIGEREGCPYFTLEYVDGGSLLNRLDGTPLPVDWVADQIETLARALHYAHQRGIVHRDLKPANILLNSEGVPKITDFGVAKFLVGGEASQTTSGAILGTPSYMAPEQAEGNTRDVGPAADIYALGAILYHLLTGRPPFHGPTVLDTLEQVRSCEPVPPSRLQPKVPRDLETICLKCLEKDPARRYASAQVLAEDLNRFRGQEPIHARPVPAWQVALRWLRRRPTVAALLAVIVLAPAALLITSAIYQTRLRYERDEARRQRDQAATNLRLARLAVDHYCTRLAGRLLVDKPNLKALRKDLLVAAVQFNEEFVRQQQGDPSARAELASVYGNLALFYIAGGQFDEAESAYLKSLDLRKQLAQEFPNDPTYRQDLVTCHSNLGLIYMRTDRQNEAQETCQTAVTLCEELVHDYPDVMAYAVAQGACYHNLANVLRDADRQQQSLPWYGRAIALLEELRHKDEKNGDVREYLQSAHWDRAKALAQVGQHREALADWDAAARLDDGQDREEIQQRRADALVRLGDHVQAVALVKELAGATQLTPDFLYNLACIYSLASAAARQDSRLSPADRKQTAERYAEEAVALLTRAAATGAFKDPELRTHAQKDKDLDPLRGRDDFEKVLNADATPPKATKDTKSPNKQIGGR